MEVSMYMYRALKMMNKILLGSFFCIFTPLVSVNDALVPFSTMRSTIEEAAREAAQKGFQKGVQVGIEQAKNNPETCGLRCILDRTTKIFSSLSWPCLIGGSVLLGGLVVWKTYGATPADLRRTMNNVSNDFQEKLKEAQQEIDSKMGENADSGMRIGKHLDDAKEKADELNEISRHQRKSQHNALDIVRQKLNGLKKVWEAWGARTSSRINETHQSNVESVRGLAMARLMGVFAKNARGARELNNRISDVAHDLEDNEREIDRATEEAATLVGKMESRIEQSLNDGGSIGRKRHRPPSYP